LLVILLTLVLVAAIKVYTPSDRSNEVAFRWALLISMLTQKAIQYWIQ